MFRFKKIVIFLCCLGFLFAGALWSFSRMGDWLSVSEEPRRSDVIICLNAGDARVQRAVELFRQGYGDKILVTYPSTLAKVIKFGVPDTAVLSLQGGYNSTFEEALDVVRFMDREKLRSAIIVSDPYHMYRAKWTYDYLTDVDTIALTYTPSKAIEIQKFWWNDVGSRRIILNEVPKIAYYWIAHGLLGIDYDPEWVSVTEKWYAKVLKRFV